MMKLKRALIVVDVQNDFLPAGALGISGAGRIVPVINRYIRMFSSRSLPVFATRDWHPRQTAHFKAFGGTWPVHCVAGSRGAHFDRRLKLPKEAIIVSKGMDPRQDSYSAFQAFDSRDTPLAVLLQLFGIKEIFIAGLATDYCVKWSARDALRNGFKVYVLTDAIKGVDLTPSDSENALAEISAQGANLVTLREVEKLLK